MVAIISMAGMLIFSVDIIAMDIMIFKKQEWRSTAVKIATNPPTLGMIAG